MEDALSVLFVLFGQWLESARLQSQAIEEGDPLDAMDFLISMAPKRAQTEDEARAGRVARANFVATMGGEMVHGS